MPPSPGGSRSSTARPILPPTATSSPAAASTWPISAVVVDLPLVPVMATKRARPAGVPASRAKAARCRRRCPRPPRAPPAPPDAARDGSAARRATGPGRRACPSPSPRSRQSPRRVPAPAPRAPSRSSQATTSAPPRPGGAHRRQAAARQPEDGDLASPQMRERHPPCQRSFSVDRPISASTTETIQKRMTTCGSVQPSCSKWWWDRGHLEDPACRSS